MRANVDEVLNVSEWVVTHPARTQQLDREVSTIKHAFIASTARASQRLGGCRGRPHRGGDRYDLEWQWHRHYNLLPESVIVLPASFPQAPRHVAPLPDRAGDLHSTLVSPLADNPIKAEPDFDLPSCYKFVPQRLQVLGGWLGVVSAGRRAHTPCVGFRRIALP